MKHFWFVGVYKMKLNTFIEIMLCLQNQSFKQFDYQQIQVTMPEYASYKPSKLIRPHDFIVFIV